MLRLGENLLNQRLVRVKAGSFPLLQLGGIVVPPQRDLLLPQRILFESEDLVGGERSSLMFQRSLGCRGQIGVVPRFGSGEIPRSRSAHLWPG
jgi:hypothetical protein